MQRFKKQAAFIVGVLALSVLTNGAWQYFFDPLLTRSMNTILNIITLGISAIKNGIYQDIAKGFHESISINIFMQTTLVVAVLLIFSSIMVGFSIRRLRSRREHLLEIIDGIENNSDEEPLSIEKAKNEIYNMNLSPIEKYAYVLAALNFILVIFLWMNLTIEAYKNNAVTYFTHSKSIVSPYVSEGDRLMLESEFGQIKSSDDYERVINKIKDIASKNNVELPIFDIW